MIQWIKSQGDQVAAMFNGAGAEFAVTLALLAPILVVITLIGAVVG